MVDDLFMDGKLVLSGRNMTTVAESFRYRHPLLGGAGVGYTGVRNGGSTYASEY